MSTTKENKKELEARLYNTKPKKMTYDELQTLVGLIAKNNKTSGKPKKTSTRAPSVWNIFMADVGKLLKEKEIKGNALKFSSYLKEQGRYPSDSLEELSDKEFKKLFKAFTIYQEAKDKEAAAAKAAAESDSDSSSDSSDSDSSDSEDEKPKPKPKSTGAKAPKAKAKAKAALSESESEEEEKPKPKPSAQAPNKKEKAKAKVESEDEEEEKPKPKAKKEKVKAVDLSDEEEEEKPKPSAQAPNKPAKEAKVVLPDAGKTKVQAIKGKDYFTANVEGTLWVYELKEDGTGGEAVGQYDFETKKIAKEEEDA
jgi:DNA mismatch repair ATPase MutL